MNEKREVLFEVRYIGKNEHHFTPGNIYPVYGIDLDGDYEVQNDFKDIIVDYKSNFERIEE